MRVSVAAILVVVLLSHVEHGAAQARRCQDPGATADRDSRALALVHCLGDPDPKLRDALAFEQLSAMMRAGELQAKTITDLKATLVAQLRRPATPVILASFSALTLSEIARTDRIKAWMTDVERQEMVDSAATFLSGISDYRAFNDKEGYVHAVAHGADFALQLALNPAVTKPQLDRLLAAIATQVAPKDPGVAYWAGEPDRLARAVVFIAQRKLHTDAEWNAWFTTVMDPKPLASWDVAFTSESGIRRHHNARAFLLSVFATAVTSEDAGIRQLANSARESLKLVP
jgi:hypothetical protein